MGTTTRVAGFTLGLALATGASALLGAAVGPIDVAPAKHGPDHGGNYGGPHGEGGGARGGDEPDGHNEHGGTDQEATPAPGGLMVSEGGFRLWLARDRVRPDPRSELRFRILDESGAAVTSYVRTHGRDLHLIAVRRDLTGFQHVHPALAEDGTWSVPLDLAEAGEYRVFADFEPRGAGSGITLGHDLSVGGEYRPRPLPAPARAVTVGDYEVRLDGDLEPGRTSELTLTVSRNGTPVEDLEPYLGAYGHLVALRDGDLAYLHVHPDGEPGDGRTSPGPAITFYAEVPSQGSYRLFLDFRHGGRVHTAAFTAEAGRGTPSQEPSPASHSH